MSVAAVEEGEEGNFPQYGNESGGKFSGGDDSSIEPTDELGNGEVLHCLFPGCMKEFTSRWSLTRHTRTHTGERPFKCATCGKEFVQKCSLKRHEQTHSNDKHWICDNPGCGKRFKLKEYLDVHKRTHNKTESEALPVEEEDQVIQDAADAAGALIDQLRQRLVRMSVRHHEQLYAYQQREYQLAQSLRECTQVFEDSINVIKSLAAKTGYARPDDLIPPHLLDASIKFAVMSQSLSQDGFIDMGGPANI